MIDIFGHALLDYQKDRHSDDIHTFSSLNEEDVMPLSHLFRSFDTMPRLEQKALKACKGTILDVGCGAGSHSLFLQEQGFLVTGLDQSPGACKVCTLRGLNSVVHADILSFSGTKFDTILLLMNGIGIARSLGRLDHYLGHFMSLLKPGGQILLDSSDIIYMYEEEELNRLAKNASYYGDVIFQMTYKNKKSIPFEWLYVDFESLKTIASKVGLGTELLSKGDHYDYLARLEVMDNR